MANKTIAKGQLQLVGNAKARRIERPAAAVAEFQAREQDAGTLNRQDRRTLAKARKLLKQEPKRPTGILILMG